MTVSAHTFPAPAPGTRQVICVFATITVQSVATFCPGDSLPAAPAYAYGIPNVVAVAIESVGPNCVPAICTSAPPAVEIAVPAGVAAKAVGADGDIVADVMPAEHWIV